MIEYLSIKNFALIEELSIQFSGSFNVLTGETGAGKSIIIEALSLLLGGRAQSEYIRSATDKAEVEGIFLLPQDDPLWKTVVGSDTLPNEENTLILSREITKNGRNICRLNGRIVTLAQYRKVGLSLVDIHGQHDHQALLQGEKHRCFLDLFGGHEHLDLKKQVQELYDEYQTTKKELDLLRASEQARLQKIDFLTYQIKEIKQANLRKGEMEELTGEVNILANAGKVNANLGQAYEQLFGGENSKSAYDLASSALVNLQEVRHLDGSLANLADQLEPILYVLEDVAFQIKNFLEGLEYSPERLAESEKRLHFLQDLCKKYGANLEEVQAYGEKITEELEKWRYSSEREEKLTLQLEQKQADFQKTATLLSGKRKELGQKLEALVTAQLLELAMPDVHFSVRLAPVLPSAEGLEEVEFLICPNPGEPLLPVAKIASGGELSRIMLALKTILAETDGVRTLVFDEIDAGIGGKATQKVAEKLAKIGSSQQVLCVTHAPLIAARADHHLALRKEVTGGRTFTLVTELNEHERVEELARMFGGENPPSDLIKYAQKILKEKKIFYEG